MDDETVTNPLECPPLRWGLIGCGRVSHDFAQALKHVPTAQAVACSARDQHRAREFADKHKISKAYGSYEEMLLDSNVDIVVSVVSRRYLCQFVGSYQVCSVCW